MLLKRLENAQVIQPNQSQITKVKSVQSFTGLFRNQLKKKFFFPFNCKKSSIVDVRLGP